MGLRTNIIGVAADTTEPHIDRIPTSRGAWSTSRATPESALTYTYTYLGLSVTTKTSETKTWVANTKAACDAYVEYYKSNGKASFSITEQSPVIQSYQLVEVTTTEVTTFEAV